MKINNDNLNTELKAFTRFTEAKFLKKLADSGKI